MIRFSFQRQALLAALLLFIGTVVPAQEHAFYFKSSNLSHRGDPCRVFIGVGTSTVPGGLKVDYTVDDTPARIAGIQAGDVILTMDGVPVRSQSELVRERDKHQQGEAFALKILRDGNEMTINARFKTCTPEELETSRKNLEMMEMQVEEMEEQLATMRVRMREHISHGKMVERPILGVYENTDINANGMVIKSVIRGKGAEAAGLQAGDVVVQVDGKTITGSGTLRSVLDGHQPGEQVTVRYVRDGNTVETLLALSADRSFFTHQVERDPCKVFIGVYTSPVVDGRGAQVTGVIDGTPAKLSGVQPGDVILALNGQPIHTHIELTRERDKNKPGDAFRLTVLRAGTTLDIDARFKACTTPGTASVQENVEVLAEEDNPELRDVPLNTDNILSLSVLEAYPNPTFGPLNIRFEAEAVPTTVRILDISGRAVYTKELPQFGGFFSEQINLFSNKPGNYVLIVQQGNRVQTKQIVLLPGA